MRNNECLEEVELKFGVRTFCCDPGRGFLINGNCVPLRGVSRHQDKLYQGYALTKEDYKASESKYQEKEKAPDINTKIVKKIKIHI